MEGQRPPIDADALLAQEGFIRAIARPLVLDESRVDDVVQETWLTALQRRPRRWASLPSWLATVARNIALKARRGEERRRRRERAVARCEQVGATDELVDRVAQHRRIVDAVLGLAEPYRSTILLRFYEKQSVSEIATRFGISGRAVRKRVNRAFELLRARLDEQHGGDRRAWCLALLPMLEETRAATSAGVATGAMIMVTKLKLAVVGLLVVAVALVAWRSWARRPVPMRAGPSTVPAIDQQPQAP